MAAKPPNVLLIDCPPSWHEHDGGRQRCRAWRNDPVCKKTCAVVALVLLGAALLTGIIFLGKFFHREFPTGDPVYTVAIAGVTGLDVLLSPPPADDDHSNSSPPPAPAAAALSPVFNLTFQVDNTRNSDYDACVPGLSRADVSYGDAFLAGGSVPPFCAGEKRTSGRVAARAWGDSVTVPRFLRDQLAAELAAGDASVDVKVTMPTYCMGCGGAVLSCKPKIGGGTSPACRLDFF